MMTVPTKTMLHTRVLAEMEGWEGIGQEELAALRHQVTRQIILRTRIQLTRSN